MATWYRPVKMVKERIETPIQKAYTIAIVSFIVSVCALTFAILAVLERPPNAP